MARKKTPKVVRDMLKTRKDVITSHPDTKDSVLAQRIRESGKRKRRKK